MNAIFPGLRAQQPWLFGLAVAISVLTPPLSAAEEGRPVNEVVLVGGRTNLRHSSDQGFGAIQARFAESYYGFHPWVEADIARFGSHHAGAGLLYNFDLPDRKRFTIGTGPGIYRHEGNDPNLGCAIEFATWVELSGIIMQRRVGLTFAHLSNAHLSSRNPGTEAVGLSVKWFTW